MKSEHRHELKEHELGKLTHKAQEFFEKYGNQVLLGTLAVILVIGGSVWWARNNAAASAAGWAQLAAARNAEQFALVAEKNPNTEVAQWARLNEAENHLVDALQLSLSDRDGANKALEKAEKGFDAVLHATPLNDALRERSLYGLARTLESGSGKDPELAIKAYKSLAKDFPSSPYADSSARRAEALETARAKDFYAWFQAQSPKPEDLQRPKDGLPAGHPEIDPTKPSKGDGKFPGDLPDFKPPELEGDTKKPADPKSDGAKPDPDKAEGDKPADSKKPVEEKPADPKSADPKADEAKPDPEKKPDADKKDAEPEKSDNPKPE